MSEWQRHGAQHCYIRSICIPSKADLCQTIYIRSEVAVNNVCTNTKTISQAHQQPSLLSSADHLTAGAAPGCGAFFESATMPNPMATSMPQPAMSYHTSLTPPFVAVLPPDPPPPPPSVMVYSNHQAYISPCL
jgi:hypothetical protein